MYRVSEKSVRNWIRATQQGKTDLLLYEEKGRAFIANTPQNTALVGKLVEKGKKYKNSRVAKVIYPKQKLYDTFSTKQILDIISGIAIHQEIPLQYNYIDSGADFWDKYANRLAAEDVSNVLTGSMDLIATNLEDLDRLLASHKKVNVIDLGPGNGLPVKTLLAHLIEKKRLNRYIGIDISQDILNITENHVKEWFGDGINFEGHVRDFSTERFDDLFVEDYANDEKDMPINLVLLLSGTICNFRSPTQALQVINNSLGPQDLFLYTTKLDTPSTRMYFDLGVDTKPNPNDFLFHFIVDMLNLDESLYEMDQYFDAHKKARSISLRPKVDLSIKVKFEKGERTIELDKGEPILLWRYWHFTALDVINQFDAVGFSLMQATKALSQEYLLLISRIKTGE
jgi:uncharacterized SAM-dependent methyltransferase